MTRRETHTLLIKLNGIRERASIHLENLKRQRSSVSDNNRGKLESVIGHRELDIKEIDYIELELREKL